MQDNKVSVADVGGNSLLDAVKTILNATTTGAILGDERMARGAVAADVGGLTYERILALATAHEPEDADPISKIQFSEHEVVAFARAIEREVLATRPSVDLSRLTRYEEYGNESGGGLQEAVDGDFVRLDDVSEVLATKAAEAVQPAAAADQLEKAEFDLDAYERLCQSKDSRIAELEARLARQEQAAPDWGIINASIAAEFGNDQVGAIKAQNVFKALGSVPQADMSDAYVGAREDLSIWKKRALESEEAFSKLTAVLNSENGPTHMGEPAAASAPQEERAGVPSDDLRRTVIAHCNDLSDCAAILDEDGRFKATAAEIRIAACELRAAANATAPVAQESEQQSYAEADGCPTERAVLQRFWREHQAAQPTPSKEGEQMSECWSCKRPYTMAQRADADGDCPHCGVEIELDDEDATPTPSDSASVDTDEFLALAEKFSHESSCEEYDEAEYKTARHALIAHIESLIAARVADAQGMADCMDMVREELIEAGIIDKKTAPMFITEAVMRHIADVRKDALEEAALLVETNELNSAAFNAAEIRSLIHSPATSSKEGGAA